MSLLKEMETLGVNVDEGLSRLMGNAALYERMLATFAKMMKQTAFSPDFDCNDYAQITEKAHAIKGTAGNLSITPVYEAYSEIVRLLRENQPKQAKKELENILPLQQEILSCIERYSNIE